MKCALFCRLVVLSISPSSSPSKKKTSQPDTIKTRAAKIINMRTNYITSRCVSNALFWVLINFRLVLPRINKHSTPNSIVYKLANGWLNTYNKNSSNISYRLMNRWLKLSQCFWIMQNRLAHIQTSIARKMLTFRRTHSIETK